MWTSGTTRLPPRSRRTGAVRFGLTLATGLWMLSAAACGRTAEPEAAPPDDRLAVTTALAEMHTLRDTVASAGLVVPSTQGDVTIYASEPGSIAELPRAVGDPVQPGDLLVRFDVPAVTQELQARQAAIVDANQKVGLAQAELDKFKPLAEQGLIARNELEAKRSALLAAQAAVAQAQTQLQLAQLQVERTIVRARFPGVVTERWHQEGDFVLAGTTDPVIRVVDPTQLQIAAPVGMLDFERIRQGQTATITLPAGEVETTTVAFSPRPTDPAATTAEVRLSLPPGSTLAMDTSVRVEILIEERPDVVTVPGSAVQRDSITNAAYVMVAGDDGLAHRREVRIGLVVPPLMQVTLGLAPGDRVITSSLDVVQDGMPVRPADAPGGG
ncbi:MAG: efflux RND transporter periplasmic adaptor subunit [Vicinamibacterales bacterium]